MQQKPMFIPPLNWKLKTICGQFWTRSVVRASSCIYPFYTLMTFHLKTACGSIFVYLTKRQLHPSLVLDGFISNIQVIFDRTSLFSPVTNTEIGQPSKLRYVSHMDIIILRDLPKVNNFFQTDVLR